MTDEKRKAALDDFILLLEVLEADVTDGRQGWGKRIAGIKAALQQQDKTVLKGVRDGIKAAHDHLRRYSQVTEDVNLGIAVDVAATELDEQLSALNSLIGEG